MNYRVSGMGPAATYASLSDARSDAVARIRTGKMLSDQDRVAMVRGLDAAIARGVDAVGAVVDSDRCFGVGWAAGRPVQTIGIYLDT